MDRGIVNDTDSSPVVLNGLFATRTWTMRRMSTMDWMIRLIYEYFMPTLFECVCVVVLICIFMNNKMGIVLCEQLMFSVFSLMCVQTISLCKFSSI